MGPDEKKEQLSPDKASQLLKLLEALAMNPFTASSSKNHEFWNTQPVPQNSEEVMSVRSDGPILPSNPKIPTDPYMLPDGLQWCLIDINDEKEKSDLYLLLNHNYVEDLDSRFRFDYPANFLEWALKSPGWKKDWHIGIRSISDDELVAFISAIPSKFKIRRNVNARAIPKKRASAD